MSSVAARDVRVIGGRVLALAAVYNGTEAEAETCRLRVSEASNDAAHDRGGDGRRSDADRRERDAEGARRACRANTRA
jgi:hypothetical protein